MKFKDIKGKTFFHALYCNRKITDGRTVEPGQDLKASIRYLKSVHSPQRAAEFLDEGPKICIWGMHACHRPGETNCYMYWQAGTYLCLVRLYCINDEEREKTVGFRRKVIAMRRFNRSREADELHNRCLRSTTERAREIAGDWILAKPYKGIISL